MKVRFDLETKTKNYARYSREAPPVIGRIYLDKKEAQTEFGTEAPDYVYLEITAD